MLLSLKKTKKKQTKKTNKQQQNKQKQQQHNGPCVHHRWRCYQSVNLNYQQLGPTSLPLLSQ